MDMGEGESAPKTLHEGVVLQIWTLVVPHFIPESG